MEDEDFTARLDARLDALFAQSEPFDTSDAD